MNKIFLNEHVFVKTNEITNTISNYVPNETILISERYPPCINDKIERLIQEQTQAKKTGVTSEILPKLE